jgi:hypothetical protein
MVDKQIGEILALCQHALDVKNKVRQALLPEDHYFRAIDLLQIAILERELRSIERRTGTKYWRRAK